MNFDPFGMNPYGGAQDYYAGLYRSVYWVIGLVIAAVVIGIILNFTFLKRSNEGRFGGFWGRVYNFFSMNRFYSEGITKLLSIVSFLLITFLGIYMIFSGSIIAGILLIVFGNLLVRLFYELIIMFIILTRKTVSIDRRMSGIERFYSDDMKDWGDSDSDFDVPGFDDKDGVSDEAEAAREGELTFQDRLKEAFGDADGKPRYGYDEECRECENWDAISEDCYCEDDCLTCEKPDKDLAKAEEAAPEEKLWDEPAEMHEENPVEEPAVKEVVIEKIELPENDHE